MRCTTAASSPICSARCWLCASDGAAPRSRAELARACSAACAAWSCASTSRRAASSSCARSSDLQAAVAQLVEREQALGQRLPVRRRPAAGTAGSSGRGRGGRAARPGSRRPCRAALRLRRLLAQQRLRLAARQPLQQRVHARARRTRAPRRPCAAHRGQRARPGLDQRVPVRQQGAAVRCSACASGVVMPSSLAPVEVRDAAGQRLPAHACEPGLLHEPRRTRAARGSGHRGRQVGVGRRVAAHEAADAREHGAEVDTVGAAQQPARHRELQHHQPAAGPQHAPHLAQGARRGRRRCGCRTRPARRRTSRPRSGRRSASAAHQAARARPARAARSLARPAPASRSRGRRRRRVARRRAAAPRPAGPPCPCRRRARGRAGGRPASRRRAAASARRCRRRAGG